MAIYFLDTSAILKRYVPAEQGHLWIETLCFPEYRHKLYISQITLVETIASICRRTRENSITIADRDKLIEIFRRDSKRAYGVQLVTNTTFTYAGNLCLSHNLRAYDAVQLACALQLRDKALASKAPAPIFVCADNHLISIAATEGLETENPNNYP